MTRKHVLNVGSRKHLLFDDALTEEKEGFVLTMNPAVRDEGPVLLPDEPWERGGIQGGSSTSVMEDNGLYKLWYAAAAPEECVKPRKRLSPAEMKALSKKDLLDYLSWGDRFMLCHAVSNDGIHWEKPNVGVHKLDGSKRNNIVMIEGGSSTVFKDPTAPPSQKYKVIFGGGVRLIHHNQDISPYPGYHAIHGAVSADGIHWKKSRLIMPWYVDCTTVCYWDDRIRKYVAFCRWNSTMVYRNGETFRRKGRFYRAIGRAESRDFWNFPRPTKVEEPTRKELGAEGKGLELYNSAAVKYPSAADSYFIFTSHFHPETETLDIHLGTSRDGVNYSRWRDPFLGLGPQGSFDSKCTYMATGMIFKGHEINMYYTGFDYRHDVRRRPPKSGGIGRVRVRLDGFISQDARWSGGNLVTVPIKFSGTRLEVNMDANAGGCLKVELLDGARKPIPGYTGRDAGKLWGNDVRKTVTWGGQCDVSRLKGRTIRLNFIGRDVKLYAFQFVD